MSKQQLSFIFRVIIAAVAWFALILQQYILISNTPGNGMTPLQSVGRFLIFFTILSNLMVALSLSIVLLSPSSKAGCFFSKPSVIGGITLCILIVGLTYNIILRSLWTPQGTQRLADELLHVAVPLLYFIYWLFFAPKTGLQNRHILYWLSLPAVYMVYAMLRGANENFYPYPFIDVNKLGYSKVALNCGAMLLIFVLVGALLVFLAKKGKPAGA